MPNQIVPRCPTDSDHPRCTVSAVARCQVKVEPLSTGVRLRKIEIAQIVSREHRPTGENEGEGVGGDKGDIGAIFSQGGGKTEVRPRPPKGNHTVANMRKRREQIARIVPKIESETMLCFKTQQGLEQVIGVLLCSRPAANGRPAGINGNGERAAHGRGRIANGSSKSAAPNKNKDQ